MTSKKQKETEELLAGKNNEIDALKRRVAELEGELRRFREREGSIAAALTMAQQVKASTIEEAHKRSASTVEAAQKQAKAIVDGAQERAGKIIRDARAKADEMLSETEKQTQELLAASRRRTVDLEAKHTAINASLLGAAAEIFKYIQAYKDLYEETTGCLFDRRGDGKAAEAVPDRYESPDQLFHTLLRISGTGEDGEKATEHSNGAIAAKTEKNTEAQSDIPKPTAMPSERVKPTSDFSQSVAQVSPDSLKDAFSGETVSMARGESNSKDMEDSAKNTIAEKAADKKREPITATSTSDVTAEDKKDTEECAEASPDAAIADLLASLTELVNQNSALPDTAHTEVNDESPYAAQPTGCDDARSGDNYEVTDAAEIRVATDTPETDESGESEAAAPDTEDREADSAVDGYPDSGLVSDKKRLSDALSFLFSQTDSDE